MWVVLKSEMLKYVGSVIYSIVFSIGFSIVVLGLIILSGFVVVVMVLGSLMLVLVGSKVGSSFWLKVLSILGGLFIGVFMVVLVIMWLLKMVLFNLFNKDSKCIMKCY